MRGKISGQRAPAARPTGHVNMAAYHAFAMQQRALLQHALTYETMIQTTVSGQQHMFPGHPHTRPSSAMLSSLPQPLKSPHDGTSVISTSSERDKDQSSPKLEQVTPPHSPPEEGQIDPRSKQEPRYSLVHSEGYQVGNKSIFDLNMGRKAQAKLKELEIFFHCMLLKLKIYPLVCDMML